MMKISSERRRIYNDDGNTISFYYLDRLIPLAAREFILLEKERQQ